MPQGTRPDWVAIRTEYESGVPRREICDRYGVNANTLDTHIKRGKWKSTRDKLSRNRHEAVTKKIVQEQAKKAVSSAQLAESNMLETLEMQRELLRDLRDRGKYTMLDLQRSVEIAKAVLETPSLSKEDKQENQLVAVLRMAVGKGADADIPV